MKETDVLIIGNGIAGATTALITARRNPFARVTVLTRADDPNETNTRYAQGGIIAKGGPALTRDILKSGDGISLHESVDILVAEGPRLVKDILRDMVHVPFDLDAAGNFAFALEGGHGEARVAKVSDFSGRAIQEQLTKSLKREPNIELRTGITAIDLLTLGHHSTNWMRKYEPETCVGVYGFDQMDGHVSRILAKKTVLATGGAGRLFAYTTNPKGARGDGIAMAYRAGAKLLGLEFEQFHPTALRQTGADPFLISEAVRGAGARLTDEQGRPFMHEYYPHLDKPDLTTRDKVSRAIFTEMLKTGAPNVYLDLRSYIKEKTIKSHFPTIYQTCLHSGIDITRDLVPVSPAAHYSCGGVVTDMKGRTSIRNLYAVGEVACTGLHGGNRLASTSLLEGLVFGVRAAGDITKNGLGGESWGDLDEIVSWKDQGRYQVDSALIAADLATVQNIMWNMVGLVRKAPLLTRAMTDLAQMEDTVTRFYREAILSDELLGLRNTVLTALLIAKSALANPKSIGCHYRED
ncbi:hypothetical protein A2Z00_03845 [Candidatus Gottesmanbacteria bacterium RBG_13_45_10]|uniref:L-aspartate oxidase n=1 Tax=Candidatus Gottesmanbacteria bacterium RBG_13_45_10 TaxID=1798370 RepID=A0A1F5ZHA9_9BACT|nr:MAG: hypothetical protein A2Z00_03845 [Candidatus Gottesmanbacteria bacterium RBG_13_45_10]